MKIAKQKLQTMYIRNCFLRETYNFHIESNFISKAKFTTVTKVNKGNYNVAWSNRMHIFSYFKCLRWNDKKDLIDNNCFILRSKYVLPSKNWVQYFHEWHICDRNGTVLVYQWYYILNKNTFATLLIFVSRICKRSYSLACDFLK
jgi:hypothetical protein